MGCRDEHYADISYLHKLGIIGPEQSDHVFAEYQEEQYHQTFDNDAFKNAEL